MTLSPMPNARSIIKANKNVEFTNSAEAALNGADVLAVITEWLEFRSPNFEDLARKLKAKAIFDGRNLYDPATVRDCGSSIFWYRARNVTKQARTLVTGVAGFIGSFVAQRLLERGE